MSFLYPSFLWALAALASPVIIHLFQLRRFKRIDFPNVRFLREVSQQTRQRRKVQHWLVLIARMAAIASLVLAFAQPYVPAAGQRGRSTTAWPACWDIASRANPCRSSAGCWGRWDRLAVPSPGR